MRHCTICGEESEDGSMMQVSRGPKQYVCPSCGDAQKTTQFICLVIAVMVGLVIMACAFAQ